MNLGFTMPHLFRQLSKAQKRGPVRKTRKQIWAEMQAKTDSAIAAIRARREKESEESK